MFAFSLANLFKRLSDFLIVAQIYWRPRHFILFKNLPFNKNSLILDCGCAEGAVSLELARRGNIVIGIDKAIDQIKEARRLACARKIKGRLFFVVADAQHLPLKRESVEYIVCLDVLEFMPNLSMAISEYARALKSRGELLITLPQGYSCGVKLFKIQRLLRKLIPRFLFSRDLPAGRSWLEVDDVYLMAKLGDVRNYTLDDIKQFCETLFSVGGYAYFLKLFGSLATDISYGVKGFGKFKFLFLFIGVRLDYYFKKAGRGYGLFVQLSK